MRLWPLILVFSVVHFGPVMAESSQQEVWYDASGEIVKRVGGQKESRSGGVLLDWEPAWIVRERNSATRSQRGAIRRGFRFRQRYSSWGLSRYGFWNGMRYTAIYERSSGFPGKRIPRRGLRFTSGRFYR